MRRGGRPSWLRRVESGTREAGATGIGALKAGAVVVVADVCTAVDIGFWASSRAGLAFFLLGCEESTGASRPNDSPTADAPTTVAVAQSCGTKMRQSWHSVRLAWGVSRGETGRSPPLSEAEQRLRDISKQSKGSCDTCRPHTLGRRSILTLGQVFILVRYQAAGESSLVETLVTTR
jgi:hypothetical protein